MNRFSMERLDYDDYSMVECDYGEFVAYEQHAGALAAKDRDLADANHALLLANSNADAFRRVAEQRQGEIERLKSVAMKAAAGMAGAIHRSEDLEATCAVLREDCEISAKRAEAAEAAQIILRTALAKYANLGSWAGHYWIPGDPLAPAFEALSRAHEALKHQPQAVSDPCPHRCSNPGCSYRRSLGEREPGAEFTDIIKPTTGASNG